MTYKLLVVDLDGTLLRRDGEIHEADRAAIARLQAAGVPVTIATGRLYSGTREVARAASVVGPVACIDGSHIVDARDDQALHSRTLMGEHAAALRGILERHEATTGFLFAQDSIVHDARGEPLLGYVRSWSPNVTAADRVTSHPYWEHHEGVHAVVALGPEAEIKGAVEAILGTMPEAAFVLSFPVKRMVGVHAMLVRAAGATKGTAVAWLANHYGCSPLEVVAVGDWLNDVPMFQAAGRSFVMAQAPKAVKAEATDELKAPTGQGGGIAEAIERAWGRL